MSIPMRGSDAIVLEGTLDNPSNQGVSATSVELRVTFLPDGTWEFARMEWEGEGTADDEGFWVIVGEA